MNCNGLCYSTQQIFVVFPFYSLISIGTRILTYLWLTLLIQ